MYQNPVYRELIQNHALSTVLSHILGINQISRTIFYNIYLHNERKNSGQPQESTVT